MLSGFKLVGALIGSCLLGVSATLLTQKWCATGEVTVPADDVIKPTESDAVDED